ncbi:LOW QUALITY PROTEIN: hypothetical protein M8C21_012094, partial [Ambrosia artemisiifolia]
ALTPHIQLPSIDDLRLNALRKPKIYLSTPNKIEILVHGNKRTFVVQKDGFPDAVVWNPGEERGALESAGVLISIFNIVFNIPLLSVATSFVAEDIAKHAKSDSDTAYSYTKRTEKTHNRAEERRQLPSVSTALVLSVGIGILEAIALYFGAGTFLNLMGISSASSMRVPAQRFLQLRALGAPAFVVSLAIQGVANLAAVFFLPILMYVFGLGVTGAAISTNGEEGSGLEAGQGRTYGSRPSVSGH